MKESKDKALERALKKKAFGYDAEEVTEEYAAADGEMKLVKRKVTKKNVPPDLAALKMLMEEETPCERMSDEELRRERERLIALLDKEENVEEKKEKRKPRSV